MKNTATIGNLLAVLVPLSVLLFTWGISITSRLDVNDAQTQINSANIEKNSAQIEKVDDKIDKNFKIMHDKLDKILFHSLEK